MDANRPSAEPVSQSPREPPDPARVDAWKRHVAWSFWSIVLCMPAMAVAVSLGFADRRLVSVWAPLATLMAVFTWVALDRGWSFGWKDPALTLPQIAYSIASTAACYAMLGPMRAIALTMTCLAFTFSIFALSPRQVRALAAYTIALFAIVMVVMAWSQPDRYHWAIEASTFGVLLLVVPSCAVLSERMSTLREHLGKQKSDLRRALARIEGIAEHDDLTGLANRRFAQRTLPIIEAEARRGQPAFVALIDIDHFKRINDRHGHAVGDEVLRRFADRTAPLLRPGDVLARWGGEEFLLIVRTGEESTALAICERVRRNVAELRTMAGPDETLAFTVSIGLARQTAARTGQDTVAAADATLYRAKAAGRDRVEVEADGIEDATDSRRDRALAESDVTSP